MFEELMRTTGNDEKATRMALSIIENYVKKEYDTQMQSDIAKTKKTS